MHSKYSGNFAAKAAAMVLALGIALSGQLFAQGNSATITGTVTDSSGAAVPNASVQIKNLGTGQAQTAPTNGQGRYTVADISIGEYEAQATAQGFQTVVRKGITLTVGAQAVVDFSLQVGQTKETVTVDASVTQVDTTSSAVGTTVEQTQIADLPLNGRNFTDLVSLIPGVASGSQMGLGAGGSNLLYGFVANFSVSGARADGQAYLLDGTDIQGFWNHGSGSGVLGTTLGVEAISEFSVLTNTYSAQYGGNGSVVNSASKSGTNEFHGSLYEFLRNSAFDARNFFDGASVPAFRQNQFGGTAGGPIKKDKMFFFVNDEELRKALGQTVIALVPDANAHNGLVPCSLAPTVACANGLANVGVSPLTAPILALYPLPTGPGGAGYGTIPEVASNPGNENYFLARFDWTISSKDSLFMRYARDAGDTVLPFAGSPIAPRWPEVGTTRNHFSTVEYRRVVSPNLINLLRFSFTRTNEADNQQTPDSEKALDFFPSRGQNGGVSITGLSSIGTSIYAPLAEVQNKFPLADEIFWSKGNHSLRMGATLNRIQSNFTQQGWWGGFYTFPGLVSFLQAQSSLFQGPEPGFTDSTRDFREREVDPYINDEWKFSPKLTINLGIRYEFVTNPTTDKQPLNAIIAPPFGGFVKVQNVFARNPSVHNFDPRIGLAYDPFGDHKTSIRVGAGIFYEPIHARTYASGYYFNNPYQLAFIGGPAGSVPFPNPFPGALPPPAQLVGVDYDIHNTPHMYQWNVNIQRELFAATTLTVGYVGSRGLHLYAFRDVNPVTLKTVNGVSVFGVPNGSGGVISNVRENPAGAALNSEAPIGDSNYNSLQVGLNRRFSHGIQSQLSYTWSKCMDNGSGTSGLEGGTAWSNPFDGQFDRGRCLFDRPQVLKLSGVYALPFNQNIFVKGWQMSGNLSAQSGPPWNITVGFDEAGNVQTGSERPNLLSPITYTNNINQWASPASFGLPAPGTLGSLQRDFAQGPGLVNLDYALLKDNYIREKMHVQFRAEFFNVLNHPNFGVPNASVFLTGGIPNPTFGKITNTSTTSRQIQFALKFIF